MIETNEGGNQWKLIPNLHQYVQNTGNKLKKKVSDKHCSENLHLPYVKAKKMEIN